MRAALALAVMTSAAAAEPPELHVEAGLGPRLTWGPGRYLVYFGHDNGEPHPAATATVTTPFTRHLAIGVHVAGAREMYAPEGDDCAYRLYSFDLAIALAYRDPRFTLVTWLGRHVSRLGGCTLHDDDWTDDFTSFGVTVTVSVFHELGLFVDAQSATGGATLMPTFSSSFNYTAITLGVAYRR